VKSAGACDTTAVTNQLATVTAIDRIERIIPAIPRLAPRKFKGSQDASAKPGRTPRNVGF
jgi:hypothetical protein